MAGMPSITETSDQIGGAGQFFGQIQGWLNDPNLQTRSANRAAARDRVDNKFAGVATNTLAPVGGFGHFNRHWRKMQNAVGNPAPGDRAWWPNITTARINEQNNALTIRLRWTCAETNLNAGNTAFRAWTTPATPGNPVVWVDISSPRAPGNVPDPMSHQANFGYSVVSRLESLS